MKSISMAPIPLKGRQQGYCWSSLPKVFKKNALHLKSEKAMSDCRDSNPPGSNGAFKMP